MSPEVVLRPGLTSLAEWHAIYRGAPVSLDPYARPDVEAGVAALHDLLARNEMHPPDAADAPLVADLLGKNGDRLPSPLVRLFVALKLGSLAQGPAGWRWETVTGLADFVARGPVPVIPAEGVSDRSALSYLYVALTGTGEAILGDLKQPAAKALKQAGLSPLSLTPHERSALLSGAAFTTAAALAGLFEAERMFQSGIVAAALSLSTVEHPAAPLHRSVHRLLRQPGQIDVAACLRTLLDIPEDTAARPADLSTSSNGGAESVVPAMMLKMGACLDLMRQAGATLERAANAVTEERLLLWQRGELVRGAADLSSIARTADTVALALGIVGDLSRARVARLTRKGDVSGAADDANSAEAHANGFMGRIAEQGESTPGVRRLLSMAGTTALVLAVEFLAAARAAGGASQSASPHLQAARDLLREAAPRAAETDAPGAADLAAVAERVGSGALASAVGVPLPGLARTRRERARQS